MDEFALIENLANEKLSSLVFTRKVSDTWTRQLCDVYLYSNGLRYQVSQPFSLDGKESCFIVKVQDNYLKYLLVVPFGAYNGQVCSQFAFYTNSPFGSDTGITPNQASVYLINKIHPGLKVVHVKDNDGNDTTLITDRVTGQKAQITYPSKLTVPETWRNT